MKQYIKNIWLLLGVLIAELNVFFTGVSLIKFSPSSCEDIVKSIFETGKYKKQFFWLQFWFICVFVFFLFVYFNLFSNLLHETPKYRSIKLYRYGKDRYLKECMKKVFYGDLYGIIAMAAGVIVSGAVLAAGGNVISINAAQSIDVGLQFAKIFFVIALYGSITVYLMLWKNSNFAMCFMLCIMFVQLVVEIFTNKVHFFTYAGTFENVGYIILLMLLNVAVNFLVRRAVKKISLC